MTELHPITPQEAVKWYLEDKESEYSINTVYAHQSRLGHLIRWCENNDIENLNNLNGRHLQRYRTWRRDDGDLNNVSMRTQMSTLRVFLRWAENIEGVHSGLSEKVDVPNLQPNENQRDKKIDPEEAFDIIDYLRKYKYASRNHVIFELLWHTAARLGEIRAIDLDDYYPRDAYIKISHRPEGGTPLKNKNEGERLVGLSDELCKLIDDYIENVRIDQTEEGGREPLLTTNKGRISKSGIRKTVYRLTQPCVYENSCPKDRDFDRCEATESGQYARCPVNYYPHAIRRGSLTYHLLRGWSKEELGERADVTADVLDDHYDRRTSKQKLEQRRNNVESL